jgi:hypothetical protein
VKKLLNLQRELTVGPAENELKYLSKDNQFLRKALVQLKTICFGEGSAE